MLADIGDAGSGPVLVYIPSEAHRGILPGEDTSAGSLPGFNARMRLNPAKHPPFCGGLS